MNGYELRVMNVVIDVKGLSEYDAIKKTGLFEDLDFVECLNTVEQVWMYSVEINGSWTVAVIRKASGQSAD